MNRRLAALLEGSSVNGYGTIRAALIVERNEIAYGCRIHANKRLHASHDRVHRARARLRTVVFRAGEIDTERHQLRRVVAERDAPLSGVGADEQRRGRKQEQRQPDVRDNQAAVDAALEPCHRQGGGLAQWIDDTTLGGAKSGRDAEGHPGQERQ